MDPIVVILRAYLSNRCCDWLYIQTVVKLMSNLHNFDQQPIYAIGRFSSFLSLTPCRCNDLSGKAARNGKRGGAHPEEVQKWVVVHLPLSLLPPPNLFLLPPLIWRFCSHQRALLPPLICIICPPIIFSMYGSMYKLKSESDCVSCSSGQGGRPS